jgi:hypothetical protein
VRKWVIVKGKREGGVVDLLELGERLVLLQAVRNVMLARRGDGLAAGA